MLTAWCMVYIRLFQELQVQRPRIWIIARAFLILYALNEGHVSLFEPSTAFQFLDPQRLFSFCMFSEHITKMCEEHCELRHMSLIHVFLKPRKKLRNCRRSKALVDPSRISDSRPRLCAITCFFLQPSTALEFLDPQRLFSFCMFSEHITKMCHQHCELRHMSLIHVFLKPRKKLRNCRRSKALVDPSRS